MIEAAPFPAPGKRMAAPPRGSVGKCLQVEQGAVSANKTCPKRKGPIQPACPPPAHCLTKVDVAKDEANDDDDVDVPGDSVGVGELVEEIIDSDDDRREIDPCGVRFKNLRQFLDKTIFEAWLKQYFNLPEGGDLMK